MGEDAWPSWVTALHSWEVEDKASKAELSPAAVPSESESESKGSSVSTRNSTKGAAHTTDATESTRQSQVTGQYGQGKAVSRSVSHSMANSVEGLTFTGYDCGNYPQAKPKCESDAFLCHDTMPLGGSHHIESGTNITHSLPNLTCYSPPSH